MDELPQHEMRLAQTHATGVEEWFCRACGRRFVMQWPPAYKKIILEAGDEQAIHSGGKGSLVINVPGVTQAEEPGLVDKSQDSPWAEWLDDIDFDHE